MHLFQVHKRKGFTLVETLAVAAIILVCASLGYGGLQVAVKKTRMAEEIASGRALAAAYLAAANDNEGRLLPGYDFCDDGGNPVQVTTPDGSVRSGPEASRYPLRLGPYLEWNLKPFITWLNRDLFEGVGPDDSMYYYNVSVAPALGMNVYCVGGYETGYDASTSSPLTQAKSDIATLMAQVPRVSQLVLFASARSFTSASSPMNAAGSHYVQPPRFGNKTWSATYSPASPSANFGHVEPRYNNRAVTVFLDGHIEMRTLDDLRDMRLWSRLAQQNDDPNHVVIR